VDTRHTLFQLPQFGLDVQRFDWLEAESFHYICFWIIFAGSLSFSFSRRRNIAGFHGGIEATPILSAPTKTRRGLTTVLPPITQLP
jgi:hypothetical protein